MGLSNASATRAENRPDPDRPTLRALFDDGLEFRSDDGDFTLKFHNETQIDGRIYDETGQRSLDRLPFPIRNEISNGFSIPRQRLYFNGTIYQSIGYEFVLQHTFGSLGLLHAFGDVRVNDNLNIRVGRYRTPFSYEWWILPNLVLTTPERSLFGVNFAPNRQTGATAYGTGLDDRLEYALGLFNGGRNGFIDTNDGLDFLGYLDVRPFARGEGPLQHQHLGGSINVGNQDDLAAPRALRTSANFGDSVGLNDAVPAFFRFNPNVREFGRRVQWGVHLAYFVGPFSLIAEWEAADNEYGFLESPAQFDIPIGSYYVQAGYFLTGEQITQRTLVEPLRPFNPARGQYGPGAIELAARYSQLELGREVFDLGLADPALWSRDAGSLDLGVNWYWNRNVKFLFDWQHTSFGSPVVFGSDTFRSNSDLFWARMQIYF